MLIVTDEGLELPGHLGAPERARQQGVNPVDYLRQRGFIQDITDEAGLRAAFANGPVTAYIGFDPTGPSLHAGHMVSIMLLATLQRMGHRPIGLGGGGTAMVGDPTGKTSAREMISLEDLDRNLDGITRQLERYLDFEGNRFDDNPPALLLNNADWLLKLQYIPFLRDIGRHFSVNEMLAAETYRTRLESTGLNFVEFNYRLVQAYDFLHLFREHGCTLQMGGSDQWGNITAGVDLIRRADGGKAFAFVSPLITTATGEKMGKTGSGLRVWLDPEQFSPYDYYQYWVNTDDALVADYLRKFTFMVEDEIAELTSVTGEALREAKQILAFEATALAHGHKAAEDAFLGSSRFLTYMGKRIRETPQEWLRGTAEILDSATEKGGAAESPALRQPSSNPESSNSVLMLDDQAQIKAAEVLSTKTEEQQQEILDRFLQTLSTWLGSTDFEQSLARMESGMETALKRAASTNNLPNIANQTRQLSKVFNQLKEGTNWTSTVDALQVPVSVGYLSDIADLFPTMDPESDTFKAIQNFVFYRLAEGIPLESAVPTLTLERSDLEGELTLADAFVLAELAKSRGEARRLAKQGGLSVNDQKVSDVDVPLRDAFGEVDALLLRAGKKRFRRVVVQDRS